CPGERAATARSRRNALNRADAKPKPLPTSSVATARGDGEQFPTGAPSFEGNRREKRKFRALLASPPAKACIPPKEETIMKRKFLLAGLVAASIGVSAAVAAPPAGKGKPQPTGAGCKPLV